MNYMKDYFDFSISWVFVFPKVIPISRNAEFQKMAKGGKKAFLSGQWKEIEENNRMGKTSNLFKN